MLPRLASLALISSLAVGCGGRAAVVGGGVLAGAGLLVVASAASEPGCQPASTTCDVVNGAFVDPFLGGVTVLGVTAIVIGSVILIAGLNTPSNEAPAPVQSQVITPAEPSAITAEPSAITAEPREITAEPVPAVASIMTRPANRLALQVSVIARAGQCEAAILTAERLAQLDPDLYRELVAVDAGLAQCLRTQAPTK